jgi:hypothetical protein
VKLYLESGRPYAEQDAAQYEAHSWSESPMK